MENETKSTGDMRSTIGLCSSLGAVQYRQRFGTCMRLTDPTNSWCSKPFQQRPMKTIDVSEPLREIYVRIACYKNRLGGLENKNPINDGFSDPAILREGDVE